MTAMSQTLSDAPPVRQGDEAESLEKIAMTGCEVAIWHRRPLPAFQQWVDRLPAERLPTIRTTLPPAQVETVIDMLCHDSGMTVADAPFRRMLCGDIAALATLFARIMQTPMIRLRLETVEDNACHKFHQDYVPARLISTYRGPGTEYRIQTAGAAATAIRQLDTGSAALFRGRLWPSGARSTVQHRSPPIEGLGETRLLLVIDTTGAPA